MKTLPFRVAARPALVGLAALAAIFGVAVPDGAAQQGPLEGIRKVDPRWHALIGATVVTEPGQTIENATLVIRDGVITSVTAGGPTPTGARVWDYSGLTIYPGLIEAHHPVKAPAPDAKSPGAHWNKKVTPQRSALDGEGIGESDREKLRKMGFGAAAISPDSGIFRGSAAVVLLDEPTDNDSSAQYPTVVRHNAYQELAFESGGFGRAAGYPGSQMGAIALIRQTLLDADWYDQSIGVYERNPTQFEPPAAADALAAIGPRTNKEVFLFDIGDDRQALRAGKIAEEFERQAMLLGSGTELRRLDEIAEQDLPIILPLAFPKKPSVSTIADQNSVTLSELMMWEQAPTNPRRLHDAGLTIALTTDKGGKGANFMDNLRSAIKHGLSADAALAMLTTNPAEMLGVGDRLGRIAPGYLANVVVVDGDDLFAKKTEIRDVWVAGRRHEINEKEDMDLTGQWAAVFDVDSEEHPATLTIKKGNKLTFDFDGFEGVKARDVKLNDNRLSFLMDGADVGKSGVFAVSGVVRGEHISGVWLDVDGAIAPWRADRTSAGESAKDDEEKDSEDEDAIDVPEELPTPFGAYGYLELPAQEDVIVTGATIWTAGPEGIIENGSLVISGGKIIEVRRGAYDNVMGMRVIQATGKHITPGIIDAHSHTGIDGGVNEGTHAVTSEVRIADVIDPDDISWYRELAGGLTVANQLHGSANPIGGQNSVVKIRWGSSNPDDLRIDTAPEGIKFALGENVKQSNWGSEYTTRYPQTRMGVETIIRDRFIMAEEYGEAWDAYNALSTTEKLNTAPPRPDLQLEALLEILEGDRLVHSHSYRQDEILMLCRVAQDFGFTIGTFQHVLEGYKVAEAIEQTALGASTFSDWWAYKFEVFDAIPYNGAIMHDVGVRVSFNSDSDELARRLNTEAGKAVKYGGVPREEAIKFVTYNPAVQLGIADRVGSLAEGKDADFVIWSGDPLSYMSRAEATFVEGRELFSIQKDQELRDWATAERQRIIQKVLAKKGGKKSDDEGDKPSEASSGDTVTNRAADASPESHDADYHREYMLELLRAGGDPTAHRCGDCGVVVHD